MAASLSAFTPATARPFVFTGSGLNDFALEGVSASLGAARLDKARAQHALDTDGPVKDTPYVWGLATSPEIASPQPFDEIVVSWNATCPPGSWLMPEARARTMNGWTRWYSMGWWTHDGSLFHRSSVKGQTDGDGQVKTDTIVLNRPSTTAQVRIKLCSLASGACPALHLVACDLSSPNCSAQPFVLKAARLEVPELSQLSYSPHGGVWCSPTSVAMVMNYWAEKMGRSDWETGVAAAAAGIHDEAWDGTGNWAFNTAFAGSHEGMLAYCARLDGFGEVAEWITRGVPVILSISNNILHGRSDPSGGGHLLVCVGFDDKGNVIVNDPYTKLDRGERVRRTYPREKLLEAWRESRCLAYLIYPESLAL